MDLKTLIPEINQNQYRLLRDWIEQEIIGPKMDVRTLVMQSRRQEAKEAGAINTHIEQQLERLDKAFGIENIKEVKEWWK